MLKKIAPPEVTIEAPFANDALSREASIVRLTNLVKSTEQPFVLSVEAPWGWGKTTFVEMWKAHLESKGHTCLYFNAWKNDFVDDPLIAFIGEITKLIEKEKNELNKNKPIKKHLAEVKRIGAGVLRKALPVVVKIASQAVLKQDILKEVEGALSDQTDTVADFVSELAKERLKKYEDEINGIDSFRTNLEKLTHEIVTRENGVSPVVFFIDELDRCRPDFAIALLERVKHLFNVKQMVFVLSIDRAQLNESVKALYGLKANPDGYLRKFIDLTYSLPAPTTALFIDNLYNRFSMDEFFNQIHRQSDAPNIWKRAFAHCVDTFNLSLRAQEQCFTEMNVVWRMSLNGREVLPAPLALYSALRAFRPNIFHELRQNKVSIETATGWFADIKEPVYKVWFEAAIINGFCSNDKIRLGKLTTMRGRYESLQHHNYPHDRHAGILAVDLGHGAYQREFQDVLSLLEFSGNFR